MYIYHRLNNISEEYIAIGKADARLTDESVSGRVCGGIGILWQKSIAAYPVDGISSDRICAIRFAIDDGDKSLLTIIGVYMPCLDQGIECYKQHLFELERVISFTPRSYHCSWRF